MVKISVGAMGRNPMGVTPNFDFAQFLRVCKKHNVRAIDTARVYPQNEELLTRAIKANGWEKDFDISTKSFGPLASGVLVKPIDDLVGPVKANSRMEALPFIQGLYLNDDIVKAVRHLETTCQKLGISKQNATLRYMLHHSGLSEDDSIILGASSPEQLESNLAACEGGTLDREALKAFETLWDQVKGRKPKYHT
ncbi:hypothetical protein CBOM_00901 [Ceraceosorus bombacis]|uniref:NADP-dependent oxidoreductase domain-containing protein n=1 Tax=Ceraceosorus bombacis TaxID=401625 RepID=A0A0P1BAT7_9BASI|nr:hypothetical protein CBOM_00901 [Ceraceosorus bombacis]